MNDNRELIAAVEQAYGFSSLENVSELQCNWGDRILLTFSAAGQRYLLKEFWEKREYLPFNISVQDYAYDNGAPVPKIVSACDHGKILDWEGRSFTLQHFMGQPHDPNRPRQITGCAKALGHYHRVIKDSPIKGGQWDVFYISRHHLDGMKENVCKTEMPVDDKRIVHEVLAKLGELLEVAKSRMPMLDWYELPLIPVHGDFHKFNCRYEGDRVAAIVDFDNARMEPRLYDVAYAVNEMFAMEWTTEEDGKFLWSRSHVPDLTLLKNWLVVYNQHAPSLSEGEKKLLPLVCAAVWPETIHGFYPKTREEVSDCDNVIKVMEYFLDNHCW